MTPKDGYEPAGGFGTTRWSLVTHAAGEPADAARPALEELCAAYWYPLYAHLRRRGFGPHDASDLVQGFFATLLEKGWLEQADRTRGRFRSWLVGALGNFASNERARARAQKRGGDRLHLSLDFEAGEQRYQVEPPTDEDADALYERRYATTLIERALARLAARYRDASAAKAERYEALRPYLLGEEAPPYQEAAEHLGLSETAVKVAVYRLRGHFRDALRAEIADTLDAAGDVDEEIRHLLAALRQA